MSLIPFPPPHDDRDRDDPIWRPQSRDKNSKQTLPETLCRDVRKWFTSFISTFIFTTVCACVCACMCVCVCVWCYICTPSFICQALCLLLDALIWLSPNFCPRDAHSLVAEDTRAINVVVSQIPPPLTLYATFADFVYFSWFQHTHVLMIPKSVLLLTSLLYTPAHKPRASQIQDIWKKTSLSCNHEVSSVIFHLPQWSHHPVTKCRQSTVLKTTYHPILDQASAFHTLTALYHHHCHCPPHLSRIVSWPPNWSS